MNPAMKLQLAMRESLGGQQQAIPAARGNVIVYPSGSHVAAAYTPIDDPADDLATSAMDRDGRGEELLRLESCWLDLTSDIASFMELSQIPEVAKEEEETVSPLSPPLMSPCSLVLPDNVMEDEDTTEMMMNANMKILDKFIMETSAASIDNSLDSFASDLDSNQSLIDEVENYLLAASGGEPTAIIAMDDKVPEIELKQVLRAPTVKTIRNGHGQRQTELATIEKNNNNILKALMAGKVLASGDDDDESMNSGDLSLDLTEEDLSHAYTTTIKTESGQDVIIIIAQSAGGVSPPTQSPYSLSPLLMSSPEYSSSASSDYEWSPSPAAGRQPAGQPQRKKYQRKNKPTLALEPYPRDKTERKKAQNRTAAFRYREKKKAELDAADSELEQLADKNSALKARLRDMQQEFRCLKRIMVDTGLGHLIPEATSLRG